MSDIYQKYADVLVNYSTKVKKNDLVLIKAESYLAEPLVKEIYRAVLKNGANPLVRTGTDGLSEIFIQNATDEQLEYVDEISKLEYNIADKYISIGAPLNVKSMAKCDSKKMAKRSKATRILSQTMLKRSEAGELAWVIADFPTHALAQEAKMSLDEYKQFIIESCYLDLDNPTEKWLEIGKEQKRIVSVMNGTRQLHITGEKTDITFNVEGRLWVSCDGANNFPDGEIFTSPVEDSAQGEIYFDFPAIYHGNMSHKIHLELDKGKVVKASAETGEDFLLSMLDMDEGSRFVGEIAIGTNERIKSVTGNILFDEKIGGSIHMALGASYPETGGKNVSGLHWDIIKNMKQNSAIYADDKLIYKDGHFVI
ncbi:MAG: aminopeptidase [Candidatus Gastranaerophilales bacterium]|nr:aminopeptidase [Candidatus Gastranaerophilales bacterium]